jgi:hypothetical protein
MQIKIYKSLLFTLACLPLISLAQQNTISPYSAFGIGEVQNQGFALNRDLGGLGLALRPNSNLNPMNPASLSALSLTSFEAGVNGSAMFLSDHTLSQEYFTSTMSYLSLGFPIKEGFAVSVGLLPYSFQGYEISQNFNWFSDGDSLNYSVDHKGSGGLNRAYINFGVELIKGLSVGATGSSVFGTLNQNRDLIFEDDYSLNRRDNNSYHVSDYTYDFGVQYQMDFEGKQLTFGATYSPQANLSADNEGAIYTYDIVHVTTGNQEAVAVLESVRDTFKVFGSSTNSLVLPRSCGVGLAMEKEDHWLISGEYDFNEWSQMSLSGLSDPQLRNASQYKIGMWWIPNIQDVHNYLKTIQYRAGFNYNTGHLSVSALGSEGPQTEITDMSLSLGLGLPIKRSKTTANLGIQFGKRGTGDSGLVEEKYIKFHVAFTFNDKWFTKRKID